MTDKEFAELYTDEDTTAKELIAMRLNREQLEQLHAGGALEHLSPTDLDAIAQDLFLREMQPLPR